MNTSSSAFVSERPLAPSSSSSHKRSSSSLIESYGVGQQTAEYVRSAVLPPPPPHQYQQPLQSYHEGSVNRQWGYQHAPAITTSKMATSYDEKPSKQLPSTSSTERWVMYQDRSGHFYWHNHVTGESQWAKESATQYGTEVDGNSHSVDFTRATAAGALQVPSQKESAATSRETDNLGSDVSEDGSETSGSVSWDSEDEDYFADLLETDEGQAALQAEQEEVAQRLEHAQQQRKDGYWAWLLPYHGFDQPVLSDVSSSDEEDGYDDSSDDDDEGDDDAEDLQHPRGHDNVEQRPPSPIMSGRRRKTRLRTKTMTVGPPTFSSKAARVIRGIVSATRWAVSTGLVTLYTFARVLVVAKVDDQAIEIQRWQVEQNRRQQQAMEAGTLSSSSSSSAVERRTAASGLDSTVIQAVTVGGRVRALRKPAPPPLDLSQL